MIQKICLTVFTLLTLLSSNAHASLDVSLKGIDDERHKISEYIGQGKWVVLNIWGTRCPPCREEVPELVRFHDEHHDNDAIVVGIAIDFPILLSDSEITEKLGLGRLEGLPTTYIFNPQGKVVSAQVGGIDQATLEKFIEKLKLQAPGSENQ